MISDDRNHNRAIRVWTNIETAFVPTAVIFELAFFFVKYKLDLVLLEKVVTDPKVQVIANNLEDILFLTRHSGQAKHYDDVGDFLILSVSERLGIELKTFDEGLSKRMKA